MHDPFLETKKLIVLFVMYKNLDCLLPVHVELFLYCETRKQHYMHSLKKKDIHGTSYASEIKTSLSRYHELTEKYEVSS